MTTTASPFDTPGHIYPFVPTGLRLAVVESISVWRSCGTGRWHASGQWGSMAYNYELKGCDNEADALVAAGKLLIAAADLEVA